MPKNFTRQELSAILDKFLNRIMPYLLEKISPDFKKEKDKRNTFIIIDLSDPLLKYLQGEDIFENLIIVAEYWDFGHFSEELKNEKIDARIRKYFQDIESQLKSFDPEKEVVLSLNFDHMPKDILKDNTFCRIVSTCFLS